MPTTTNFGWTTPADTDLVKDGASAIRTLGNGVDTSMVDLKGGTTGQILSKTSNTDMAFTWIAQPTGQTLINTGGTSLSGSSAVTVSSIPSTYKHLYVVIEDAYQASAAGGVYLRFNSDTGTNYYWNMIRNINTTLAGRAGAAATSMDIATRNGSTNTNYKKGQIEVMVNRYTNTSPKAVHTQSYDHDDTNTASAVVSGVYVGTSAVSSLTIVGDFNFSGGTVYVYGVS